MAEELEKKGELLASDSREYFKLKEHADKGDHMLEILKEVLTVSEIPLDRWFKILEKYYHEENTVFG